jgi:hypothetical protein
MHYKTRTFLNEAVIVRSTGCDMNDRGPKRVAVSKNSVRYDAVRSVNQC